jgi:hypothetical protein
MFYTAQYVLINVIMVAVYIILQISFIIQMQKLRKTLNHIPFTDSSSAFVKSSQVYSRDDLAAFNIPSIR